MTTIALLSDSRPDEVALNASGSTALVSLLMSNSVVFLDLALGTYSGWPHALERDGCRGSCGERNPGLHRRPDVAAGGRRGHELQERVEDSCALAIPSPIGINIALATTAIFFLLRSLPITSPHTVVHSER